MQFEKVPANTACLLRYYIREVDSTSPLFHGIISWLFIVYCYCVLLIFTAYRIYNKERLRTLWNSWQYWWSWIFCRLQNYWQLQTYPHGRRYFLPYIIIIIIIIIVIIIIIIVMLSYYKNSILQMCCNGDIIIIIIIIVICNYYFFF